MRWCLLIGLISLAITLVTPAVMPTAMDVALGRTNVSLAAASPQELLKKGLAYYEIEHYAQAIQQWQQANLSFKTDPWGQALILSYLSLAQQQLGLLDEASQSLQDSLSLIDPVDLRTISASQAVIYAKVLNTQGKLRWLQGDADVALAHWRSAAQTYRQAGDEAGVAIAQINQARVLQYLGLNHQAKTLLETVYQGIQQQPNNDLKAAGLYNLSSVLRQIGDLDTALSLLQEGISLNTQPSQTSNLFLELGNTEWLLAHRDGTIGRQAEAEQHSQSAQAAYQQAINTNDSPLAQLNLFRLWVERNQIAQAMQLLPQVQRAIGQLPASRSAIHAHIHLAESLMKVQSSLTESSSSVIHTTLQPKEIAKLLSKAIQQARILKDQRAEAYALGQLGTLYEHMQQWADAQHLTQQALLTLETVDAPEIRYRWEWQLGRLRQQQTDRQGAIQGYKSAIRSLQQVRNNLLSVNTNVQFSFRDHVEPVYREYIELLLSDHDEQTQPLEEAIQTVDQLQLAELENYLGCTLDARTVDQVQDDQTAILYPIILSDRIAMIAQLPGKTLYRETLIAKETADTTLLALQANLANPSKTPEVLTDAQTVYDWLIRPLATDLNQASIQTLVFVLDGPLRNIPMAVLYDGEQYLIEKGYAVAIAPRLQIFTPETANPSLRVLMGGMELSQEIKQTQFPAIAKVREELDGISQYVDSSNVLLNESFTHQNLQQQLETGNFSAIHWKTHGVFSSDPDETYVVAYEEQISAQDLNNLIWLGSRGGVHPLELVVLSACETAQGDKRAVLGLAGLAARTGTRSVLSTLWIAQDTPNTQFMIRFYELLTQPGMSIANAVRQAQLSLIHDYGYTTPYIWANYLLIGSWL
ncbi:CHAT domain-containing protein [Adonisia turfae]|uniref:CHAT domain-containing protein n=1 Tax=Adonisia turfae CCMR0081 TaxID=2292702 RepID=A0A6M0RQY3_9CYAN|nr:CHAT domain-containing protein [Adonisia turfae]NEZ58655.1 CHAT domain-containing protein [Adonisia turfae CCMR0081]